MQILVANHSVTLPDDEGPCPSNSTMKYNLCKIRGCRPPDPALASHAPPARSPRPLLPRAAIRGSLSFSFTATAPDCGGGAAVAEVADDAPLDGFGAFGGAEVARLFLLETVDQP